jgi:hypothetical protein
MDIEIACRRSQARISFARVGKKELRAIDLVFGDRFLPFGRNNPVDECLAHLLLDVRMLRGIDQYYAVLIEQALIALPPRSPDPPRSRTSFVARTTRITGG